MQHKHWLVVFLSIIVLSLVFFAVFMYISDPLIQFGVESELFSYYEYTELYSNPGIAKNYRYDSVLVGTSMIENTDVKECNDAFSCNMVKLPYSGGTTYNMKKILDLCFQSDNQIKTVFWELDEFQLHNAHDAPRFPLPDYLYRNDNKEVLKYILNLEIFYRYTIPNIRGTLQGLHQKVAREGEYFTGNFSKEEALRAYERPEIENTNKPKDYYLKKTELNLQTNVIPLIEAQPETEFVFFMVPFSMLYWDKEIRCGTFDAVMYSVEYAMGELLKYDNVKIYFFQDEWEIVENLDNYKDYSHYGKWINSYMTNAIAADENRLSSENYKKVIADMSAYIHSYNFEKLFTY